MYYYQTANNVWAIVQHCILLFDLFNRQQFGVFASNLVYVNLQQFNSINTANGTHIHTHTDSNHYQCVKHKAHIIKYVNIIGPRHGCTQADIHALCIRPGFIRS